MSGKACPWGQAVVIQAGDSQDFIYDKGGHPGVVGWGIEGTPIEHMEEEPNVKHQGKGFRFGINSERSMQFVEIQSSILYAIDVFDLLVLTITYPQLIGIVFQVLPWSTLQLIQYLLVHLEGNAHME